MKEVWKVCPCVPYLEASSKGRIRLAESRLNYRWKKGNAAHPAGYVYAPSIKNGYEVVRVTIGGKRKHLFVHWLVCNAFHGAPPYGHKSAHCDGNKCNNKPSNLRWATQAENMADREKHGKTMRGDSHYARKIDRKKAALIKAWLGCGFTAKQVAHKHSVSIQIINDIKRGKTWKTA